MLRYFNIWVLCGLLAGAAQASGIYRCQGEAGEPLFSQRPCADGGGTPVVPAVADPGRGQGVRASETEWLRQRAAARQAGRKPGRDVGTAREQAARSDYTCRDKRRKLERVKLRLRQGYKPSQGESLRERRRAYEDYLSTFCS